MSQQYTGIDDGHSPNNFYLHHDIDDSPIDSLQQTTQHTPIEIDFNYCFVTMFYDINRSQWNNSAFSRNFEIYFLRFSMLLHNEIPLVVFIDDRYYERLRTIINRINVNQIFVYVVKINDTWLKQNTIGWNYQHIEQQIMNTDEYKQRIASRPELNTPETLYPEYNCLLHVKRDLISYVIHQNIVKVDYYGWIDFGYVGESHTYITPFQMNPVLLRNNHTIHVMLVNPLTDRDRDAVYTLMYAPERIQGGFYFGHKHAHIAFMDQYYETVRKLYVLGVADDEQAVLVHAYFTDSSLFKLWRNLKLIEGAVDWGYFVVFILFNAHTTHMRNVQLFLNANNEM